MTNSHTYLYVEDDPLNREVLQTLLVNVVGVKQLTIFENSQNFIERLQRLQSLPDFLLLDIWVEPHNGYELIAMLRLAFPGYTCKVIAVTSSIMAEETPRLKAAGFDGALSKPLDMVTFPDLIQRLTNGETIWQ